MTTLLFVIIGLIAIPISIVFGVVWAIVSMFNISKAAKILITIIATMVIFNSCGLFNHHNDKKASIQEEVTDITEINEINDKYQLALQAKNQKDWNKVIVVLNTIDMDAVKKNTEAFKAKYKIKSDKDLKTAITEERRSSWLSEEKRESRYNELIKNKPITVSQINILKQYAEGMIEFEKGNYLKAYDLFCKIKNIFESDIEDDYRKIVMETEDKIIVEVPVKIIDGTCIMKYDDHFRTELPHFTLTIENPLDEPISVSSLVERAVHKNGESAHYSHPFEYEYNQNVSLEIPARSRATYKFSGSLFLHDIKYYSLGIKDFYMKNSKKLFSESVRLSKVNNLKVEAKY